MQIIEPNTLCYLVGDEVYSDFNGQVVTVLGCVHDPDDPAGLWYSVEAYWLRAINDTNWTAEHSRLKPLHPDTILPGVKTRDEVDA